MPASLVGRSERGSLAASFRAARDITRHHAKSFYFSSFPLPADRRRAAYAVYAFCRHADDAVDRAAEGARLDEAVAGLRDLTARLFGAGEAPDLPWAEAFRHTVREYGIPRSLCDDLVHGVALDTRAPVRLRDWAELREYCYYVASVVGLMMARVFGIRDAAAEPRAVDLGIAMQLTNILRDVVEDAARDRIYLPAEELAAFGIGQESVRQTSPSLEAGGSSAAVHSGPSTQARMPAPRNFPTLFHTDRWREYAMFFAARARDHYLAAEAGIPSLAPGAPQLAVWCMREIYAAILDEIEAAEWDVSVRRHVGTARKMSLAVRAFWNWRGRGNVPS